MSDTLRVFFAQSPGRMAENTGIGRVVHAQHRLLPQHDIEIVGDYSRADLIVGHTNAKDLPWVDVVHCHGIYWTGDPDSGEYHLWHHTTNAEMAADYRRARHITVPSRWVAEPFLRDMRLRLGKEISVIGHGLDLAQWGAGECQGYALWNKNRPGDVCDPTPAWELARRGVPVVATFAPAGVTRPPSLRVTGALEHAEMRPLIQGAGVYLATTPETFGIGTLEALACGVPVLGYRWGGTADLVEHGRTGYLVEPGDLDGLVEGYAWLMARRPELSANCLDVAQGFGWGGVMAQYAALYRRVAEEKRGEPSGVSVVITNYNYGRYVSEAIDSCLAQTRAPDEIIVVDDGSTDDSLAILDRYGARVRVIAQQNQGVAAARDAGFAAATQPYVIPLDADDALDRRFIETLLPPMQRHRGLGIAYTGLGLLQEDGQVTHNPGWPIPFSWDVQSAPTIPAGNCIPSACMVRKAMWERAGGYQQWAAPGEDGEFWTRGLSVGFEARQVTDLPLFHYRVHEGSASRTKRYKAIDTWHPWMRDKRPPFAAPARVPPLVRSYSQPLVTIVVEDSPELWAVYATLDSLLGQTFRSWEVTTHNWISIRTGPHGRDPYPFLRFNETPRAPLVLHLRAGEYLAPDGLETMLKALAETGELGGFAMGCSCGSKASPQQLAQRALVAQGRSLPPELAPVLSGKVRMEFVGEQSGAITFYSQDRQRSYRGGRQSARFADVDEQDVGWLERTGQWQVVRRRETQAAPAPAEVVPTVEGATLYAPPALVAAGEGDADA